MRSFHIGQVVALGLGLILLFALLIAVLGRVAYDISRWQKNVVETRSNVERLTMELELISNQRTEALRRYLQSSNVNQLATFQLKQSAYVDTYSRLDDLLRTPEESRALHAVDIAESNLNAKAQEVLGLFNGGFPASARFLWSTEGTAAQDQLFRAVEDLRRVQGRTSTVVIEEASQTETWTIVTISAFIPILLIGGVGASILITRNITSPISSLVQTVSAISSDLTARVKPSGPKEIAFLGETINDMAQSLSESSRSLQEYKDRLENELTLASQIQASFLPVALPQSSVLELAVFWQSAREVGGDFYATLDFENGRQGIAIGDASGKGTPAAMVGALSVGLLQAYAVDHNTPETLLAELNQDLCGRLSANHMNVACIYAIFDEPARCLTIANAGCMYPYLIRGSECKEIPARGLPLGAWSEFEYEALSLSLHPGDIIVFSSDGLVEAQNPQGELFGFDRLQAELKSLPAGICAQDAVDRLIQLALDFTGPGDLHDDITILVMRVVDEQPTT